MKHHTGYSKKINLKMNASKTLSHKCCLIHKLIFDLINRGYKLSTLIIPTSCYSYFITGKKEESNTCLQNKKNF